MVLAGQSNGMSYGEGLPLPETYDRPDPRIKQLARRSTVTPGGAACKYNDIIPADHCLHDVQDMSRLNHPKADLSKGQYGTVGQGLHIAKKLLPFIPANAGILLVPCCRGGSAFTTELMAHTVTRVVPRRIQPAGVWTSRCIRTLSVEQKQH
ncbi:hypothetical protein O76HUS_14920 [Escherichia coli]|nr:hypothetical protein O76HUS_14920 [Escherichia coli]